MIEENGRVLSISNGFAEVETIRTSSCTACRARHACGHHAVTQMSSSNKMRMNTMCDLDVVVGQEVVIGVPEDTLLKASIWMYFVPLVGLVVGATFPSLISDDPMLPVMGALLGFSGGFFFARSKAEKESGNPDFMPRVLRVKTVERLQISIYQHP
ncbi:SoxR reducing system RseC family protein [Marinomonas sp. 2405UD68-3]|uniref:SoxR reducing system RseC family protein n=1 Tax=Marinomonas sp. 2405UD68-3 TaxID=3391835 RepID=UPI0039C8E85C